MLAHGCKHEELQLTWLQMHSTNKKTRGTSELSLPSSVSARGKQKTLLFQLCRLPRMVLV